MSRFPFLSVVFIGALTIVVGLHAGPEPVFDRIDETAAKTWYAEEFAKAQQAYGGDSEVKVWRGIVANRRERKVELLALGNGLASEPIEFFIVTPYGRDHEAIAVTLAKPSELREALIFIGLQPGHSVDYPELRFWPKGARLTMTMDWTADNADGKPVHHRVPAERTIYNAQTERTLAEVGMVFAGSATTTVEGNDQPVLGADVGGEVASSYNDKWSLLDVPYRAEQGLIYGSRVPNPKLLLPAGARMRIELSPMAPPGQSLVRDYRVLVEPMDDDTPAVATIDLRFTVEDPGPVGSVLAKADFQGLLDFLLKQKTQGLDVFLHFYFSPRLRLTPLEDFAPLLDTMAGKDAIRLEPVEGQLYYRAFMPVPRWREREGRIVQPVEIHLTHDRNYLVHIDEAFTQGNPEPKLTLHEVPLTTPASLTKAIADRKDWGTDTMFLFLSPDMTYGDALTWYLPVRDKFPVVYLFLGP